MGTLPKGALAGPGNACTMMPLPAAVAFCMARRQNSILVAFHCPSAG